ncbi:MAG: SLBB domain-containing protein [Spirochaetales bacterium]|nr:SLBB domain-containing protein [Spirochaetales bacterium]
MSIRNGLITLLIIILTFGLFPLTAQTIDENITITASGSTRIAATRAAYIMINTDYPLVPGDTFDLAYSQRGEDVKFSFFVEEDYTVNLTYMGKLDVTGMTFADLKIKVEELVKSSFPGSFSHLIIKTPGVFMIPVRGEVKAAVEIPAWGYMRLSSAIEKVVTNYASSRMVEVIAENGESQIYDLYQALRYGDKENDPFLKVGDKIIIHKYERMVKVSGQVRRAGNYELLPGEDLASLIEVQADGFSPMADTSKVKITRIVSNTSEFGETLYLDLSQSIPEGFALNNMDTIEVPLRADFQPKVLFQGAIGTTEAGTTVSNKVVMPIVPGEKLSSVVFRTQNQFNLGSDLTNALLTRKGLESPIEVNLEDLMLNANPENDPVLEDQDIIVIPFRQYQVFVGGQVNSPGAFPYIPNRTWEYYIGLAGGFNIDTHLGMKVKISDVYGNKHDQEGRFIQPEDIVYAPLNHPLYWIGKYGTELAVVATSITSTIVLINWIGEMVKDSYTNLPLPDDGTTTE